VDQPPTVIQAECSAFVAWKEQVKLLLECSAFVAWKEQVKLLLETGSLIKL